MSSSSFWRDFPVKKTLVLDKLEQVKSEEIEKDSNLF